MGFDLWDAGLVAGVAFLASVVGGISGYGAGLVMPVVIAPIVGVAGVIPVMAVGMSLANLSRVLAYLREVRWRSAGLVMLPGLPASFLGAYCYTLLSGRAISLLLGSFLLIIVPLRRWLARREYVLGNGGLAVVGGLHGLLAGAMSGSGLLLLSALMAAGVTGGGLIGTDATVSFITNLIKIGMFGGNGLLDLQRIACGLLMGVATFPGAFCARAIVRRMSIKVHTALMDALVLYGGATFLWQAIK